MPIPSSDPIAPTESAPSSQETDKENALPSSSVGITSAPSSSRPLPALPQLVQPPIPSGSLPGPIARLLNEVTSTLAEGFKRYPPHTIQRLAELVLEPKRHYRSLTAYLHALDRVVHVTSGSNIYPLPPAVPDMSQMSLLANGVGGAGGQGGGLQINTAAANSLGSDESLGGALLTPIPWLARRPNGGGNEDGGGSEEDGSASSPLSAAAAAGSAGDQSPAQTPPPLQQQQPVAAAASQQPQPQPQPQSHSPTAPPPATEDATPSTRPQVRTESTETIEGPNGIGSIETVSVSVNGVPSTGAAVLASRGVTQGELLRQEQRAGVVPLSQLVRQAQQQQQQQQQAQAQQAQGGSSAADGDTSVAKAEEDGGGDAAMEGGEEDVPHARGPSEIDDVDTGPQAGSGGATHLAVGSTSASGQPVVKIQGIDVEAAVGRKADGSSLRSSSSSPDEERRTSPEKAGGEEVVPRSPKREAEEELHGEGKKARVAESGGWAGKRPGDLVMGTDGRLTEGEGVTAGGEEAAVKPETDGEGDVVIRDQASSDEPAAEGEAGQGG